MTITLMPAREPQLPPGWRKLWNELRKARKDHTLECGCHIGPGTYYWALGFKAYGQIVYRKIHSYGKCLIPPDLPERTPHASRRHHH